MKVGLGWVGRGVGNPGPPPLVEGGTLGSNGRGVPRDGCGGVCHLRRDFPPWGWKWLPIDMQKARPALVLLIKVENIGLYDAFNHFGIVKSFGLWGPGWPWCEHKLA